LGAGGRRFESYYSERKELEWKRRKSNLRLWQLLLNVFSDTPLYAVEDADLVKAVKDLYINSIEYE
jgi:hypothetical protein